ncbi:hypothetical protein ARMSODRAFT_1002827 [Armillaria solidipes]|uniref:Uncharacterized protein n=1 Tax=Armillaria solidipes TaxID=1076256 RepID=A0A2H3BSB6_9AGAR|nr:hypothetical protein ARMSODRAFT_1002827 [Armillaria solidipes]
MSSSQRHISVETVKSMALDMGKSLVEKSYIAESLAETMPFSLQYADIYTDIWCNQQSPFIKELVLRDDPQDRIEVTVPETTWAFGDSPAVLEGILGRLGVRPFIRREYEVALYDIMKAKKTGNPVIIVRDDGEEIHADLTQAESTIGVKCVPEEELVDDRAQKRQHTGKVSGEHVADPPYYISIEHSLEQYANPFREEEAESQLAGFIVLGHTGIGKSIFLYYILLLRLQAKKPTILVLNPNVVTVFLQQGVFSVAIAHFDDVAMLIPDSTWCLVDSNQELKQPPQFAIQSPFFIVQAASPIKDHIAWKDKTLGVWEYIMKPFSLPELIVGRNRGLRFYEHVSEIALQNHYERYTPSARVAYQFANHPDQCLRRINGRLHQLSFVHLKKLVDELPYDELRVLDEDVLDNIVTVTVDVGDKRCSPRASTPSRHLSELFIKRLQSSSTCSAGDLHFILLRILSCM